MTAPVVVEIRKDGSVRCFNDTEHDVLLRMWGKGNDVRVSPRTEFNGCPRIQSHAMLYAVSAADVRKALEEDEDRRNPYQIPATETDRRAILGLPPLGPGDRGF